MKITRKKHLSNIHIIDKEISMKYGERNFGIISSNVDHLRNNETMRALDVGMANKKADILRIQETHNITDNGGDSDNYKIYFTKSEGGAGKENGTGEISIMIKKANREYL